MIHKSKKAYACISPRTDQALFISTCELLGYQPISFHANDSDGKAIYHTNVICISLNIMLQSVWRVFQTKKSANLLANLSRIQGIKL